MFYDPPPDIDCSFSVMYVPWKDFRRRNAERIITQLRDEGAYDVHEFPVEKDSPVRDNAYACWQYGVDNDATHHCVIQGDVGLCTDFVPTLEKALQAVPDRIVMPFSPWSGFEKMIEHDVNWGRTTGRIWGAAVASPSSLAEAFMAWDDRFWDHEDTNYDFRLSCWNCLDYQKDIWLTQPSLCEHLAPDDSTLGNNPPIDRTAWRYIGDMDLEPSAIDWSFEMEHVHRRDPSRRLKGPCLKRLNLG